jgi:polysaccharide export outer membrane protein
MGSRSSTVRTKAWAFRVLLTVATLATSGVVAAQQAASRIAVRDTVKVTVVGTEFAQGPFLVDTDGAIDYPFLGRVPALGLTTRELGTSISQRLVSAQILVGTPQVSVELQQTPNKKVTVSGAVATRGEFMFAGELSVFSALVKAGGATTDAGDEILLIRAGRAPAIAGQSVEDDVIRLSRREVERGEALPTFALEDGDRLVVSKARQVFIDGQVNRPGGYTVETGTTLRQALSLAGGASELGAVNRTRVLRNGKPVEKIDLDKTIIQPGDTITVPKRFM